jgi:hypothetical protein
MKVTQYNKGYSLKVSDHEMGWIRAMYKHINWEAFKADLSPTQHRSLAKRMCKGFPLRTDTDRRKGKAKGAKYDGPHNDQ